MNARLIIGAAVCWFAAGPYDSNLQAAEPAPPQTLQAVLERIHAHAANEDWKKGLRDEQIEAWLDTSVAAIARATEIADLKVPVHLADVQPGAERPLPPSVRPIRSSIGPRPPRLVVGKNIDQALRLQDAIVLADGHVRLRGGADGCVIIARGPVLLERSLGNVVVSGGCVVFNNGDGESRNPANGSVIITHGWVDMARGGSGTIIAAQRGGYAGLEEDTLHVNWPLASRPRSTTKLVMVPDLPLESSPPHPLAAQLKCESALWVDVKKDIQRRSLLRGGAREPFGVVFRYNDRRYVAELDRPITDEAGQPVEGLKGWQLSYVANPLAVFTKDSADVVVRIGP